MARNVKKAKARTEGMLSVVVCVLGGSLAVVILVGYTALGRASRECDASLTSSWRASLIAPPVNSGDYQEECRDWMSRI